MTEMLLNIVSCYIFSQADAPTFIFTFSIKIVSYYLPKGFVMLAQDYKSINNISTRVKKLIHTVHMHEND